MGWQDAPVVEDTPQPPAGASASVQPAWMSAPAVDQPKAQGSDFEPLIQKASAQYGVPADEVRAIIGKESSFDPKARSKKGAGGLMQLMPSTASDLGVSDVYDPAQNIDGGTRYYAQQLKKYGGDREKALAAYNWGPGNVDKFGDNYSKVMPKETNDYVRKITAQMGIKKPSGKPGDTSLAQDVARGAAGLYRGLFVDLPDAATQGLSAMLPDRLERALSVEGKTGSEQVADREKFYQQQRTDLGGEGIDLGRLAGNIVNPAGLALGAGGGAVGQVGPTVARAATAGRMLPEAFAKLGPKAQALLAPMLRGAGGAAMMPVTGSEDFMTQKAKQVGIGAALGPAAEGAGKLVASTAGRALGALRGEMQPGPAATQQLGKDMGVQLTAGDLAPQNKGLTGIEGALENQRLPFASMVPTRTAQQAQARTVAQKELEAQHKALVNATYMDVDKVRALAAGNTMRSAEAKKIVQMMDDAGPDERAIMQASGNNRWLTMKLLSDRRFDKVDELAGDTPVPPTSTLEAIDSALKSASKEVDLDPASIAQLRKWKAQLEAPTAANLDDPIETAVDFMEGTAAPAGELIPNTYSRMRKFRSDLRKRIDGATTNETTDSSKLFLKNIAASVENDLDAFAQSTPKLAEANTIAQDFYRKQVVPYQKQKLASALTADDPDQIYGAFIRSQAEGRGDYAAKRLFTALDGKGKQAVRYGIVKQAMAQATDGDEFSPTAFKKALESTEYKTYFKGADLARVDKIIQLFGHLRHADPEHLKKYSPMLGGQMGLGGTGLAGAVGGIAAGNPVGAALGAGGVIGGARLLRFLMTSDSGKKLLFSQNVFGKGGSKEGAGKLLDELVRRMSSEVGTVSGAENGQPGRVLP